MYAPASNVSQVMRLQRLAGSLSSHRLPHASAPAHYACARGGVGPDEVAGVAPDWDEDPMRLAPTELDLAAKERSPAACEGLKRFKLAPTSDGTRILYCSLGLVLPSPPSCLLAIRCLFWPWGPSWLVMRINNVEIALSPMRQCP